MGLFPKLLAGTGMERASEESFRKVFLSETSQSLRGQATEDASDNAC